MARTYTSTPVLSKVKIGDSSYYLKDADVRALLNGIDDTVWTALGQGFAASVTDTAGALVDSATIKSYVDAQVGALNKFDVRVYDSLPTATADTMYILALVENASAVGTYIEYITVRSGEEGAYTYAWEQIGSTEVDLTNYVQKTTEIAGVQIGTGISAASLSAGLGLGSFATANEGEAAYEGTSITGVAATGDISGSATLSVTTATATATVTGAEYTPAGSITGSAISGGTVTVTLTDATEATAISATTATVDVSNGGTVSFTEAADGSFQVGGTNASSAVTFDGGSNETVVSSVTYTTPTLSGGTFTANTPTTIDTTKFNGGSAASWTGATFTAGSLAAASTDTFASEGIVATVGSGTDAETLIFTAASTASAVTAQGTYTPGSVNFGTFDGGTAASLGAGFYTEGSAASYTAPSLSGGGVSAGTVTVVGTLGTATAAAQVFTGAKYAPSFTADAKTITVVTGGTYLKQVIDSATFEGTTATLGFSGTAATITPSVTYDKVTVGETATVTITGASLAVGTITVPAATLVVTPGSGS